MFRGDFALIRDSSNEKSGIMDILPAMLIFTAIGMIVTLLAAFLLAVLISSGAIPEGAGHFRYGPAHRKTRRTPYPSHGTHLGRPFSRFAAAHQRHLFAGA